MERQMLVEELQQRGESLSASPKWSPFCESIDDDYKKTITAFLLESQHRFFKQQNPLYETTTTTSPGIANFEKFAFPLIRAIFPNLVATDLVSVQPMLGPASIVFYLQFVYGSDKGAIRKGQVVEDTQGYTSAADMYSSERVELETVAQGNGGKGPYAGSLSYVPIRPGTVSITAPPQAGGSDMVVTDDGAGGLTGDGTGTVDYSNGAVSVTFTPDNVDAADIVSATYDYNMEGNPNLPEIDLVLTSSPVIARTRKLRSRWSMEAAANLRNVHGIEAEAELVAVLAEELKFEIDREIIRDLKRIANAGTVTFDRKLPMGVSWTEHKQAFLDTLVEASNLIFQQTRRATGNWVVAGVEVCNIIETLPGFVPSGVTGGMGVMKIGTLQGKWDCYKDPYMTATEFLVGYKGVSFLETGYIYAPYIPLYETPTITLDDFVVRKALGTQYGKKVVWDKFYCNGSVFTSP